MPFHFSEICILLQRHEDIETRQPPFLNRVDKQAQSRNVTESWFKSHRSAIEQLSIASSVALLSTLLPERRTDRVYNTKSPRLVHVLSRCLGLSASRTKDLHAYTQPGRGDLAKCLERVLANGGPPARPAVTLDEVDNMLQVLAGECHFSDPYIQRLPPGSSEAKDVLIGIILKRLHPCEAKWLVRLILKDFTPVRFNESEIIMSFHFLLPGVLRFQGQFDAAIGLLKGPLNEYPSHPDPRSERLHFQSAAKYLKPTVGVKVGRPNFNKARSIDHCMRMLGQSGWVLERKYDGEYCEIHIDLTKSQTPAECITIFSKSGKNSTADRKSLLPTLVNTLRLGKGDCKIKEQAILLGEMLVYSDKQQCILPFDEIRKHVLRSGLAIGTEADSFPKAGEHLAIVFFDLLFLDGEVVMNKPIQERRQWLREVYHKIGGHAIGAEWKTVHFGHGAPARRILMHQFAASIAQRCEGLVLKPCGVPYFSLVTDPAHYSHSYIKLKKDYMGDMGDEADFAVVGGNYDAQQAASSGIPGIRWTEFHLGCLTNKADVLRFDARPRFKVVRSTKQEHCIPKPILQAANALGQFCATPCKPNTTHENFDLDLVQGTRIGTLFSTPFVFEVLGSGFEKPSNCNFFMLRHARVTKLHEDRTWKDAVSMEELQEQAAAARSAAADSESQETRRWLEKLEKKSRKKFEREKMRTATPKTRTSRTPSTTAVVSMGRTRMTSTRSASQRVGERTTVSANDRSALDGTTLIDTTSPSGVKRPRNESSQTPCPPAKRQRNDDSKSRISNHHLSKPVPLADITNQAPLPRSENNPPLLKHLSRLSKKAAPDPYPSPTLPNSPCPGPSCPLHNTSLLLSPCITRTPYITTDLLSPHLGSGCTVLTSKLPHWERESFEYAPLTDTVSESPAYEGRRKVVLVEGRRREATREYLGKVAKLGLREKVEVWDWRVIEMAGRGNVGAENTSEWFVGALERDDKTARVYFQRNAGQSLGSVG